MPKKKTIDDIISDECDGRYCILQVIIEHSGMQDFILEQMKCIEKFKYEESKRQGHDIGWQEAGQLWVEEGYATKYREIYSDDKNYKQLYKEVVNGRFKRN